MNMFMRYVTRLLVAAAFVLVGIANPASAKDISLSIVAGLGNGSVVSASNYKDGNFTDNYWSREKGAGYMFGVVGDYTPTLANLTDKLDLTGVVEPYYLSGNIGKTIKDGHFTSQQGLSSLAGFDVGLGLRYRWNDTWSTMLSGSAGPCLGRLRGHDTDTGYDDHQNRSANGMCSGLRLDINYGQHWGVGLLLRKADLTVEGDNYTSGTGKGTSRLDVSGLLGFFAVKYMF